MSAFLCSTLHTVTLGLMLARQHSNAPTVPSVRALAKALRSVNNRALACRYGDKPQSLPRDISADVQGAAAWIDSHSADDAAALVQCFVYQCSEGDTETHKNWAFVDELQKLIPAAANPRNSSIWSI